MENRDLYTGKILESIERGDTVTQRRLSEELQIALGLTNLLVKRIVSKGWVKAVNVKANRLSYLITPTGISEKARITRDYFDNTVRLYTETRERLSESLGTLSTAWSPEDREAAGSDEKRIVFFGAGEVAEIAFLSLQGTDLRLVGVVDDKPKRPDFFGVPIRPASALKGTRLDGEPFGRLVVMSFRRAPLIRARLGALQFPPDRVFWL